MKFYYVFHEVLIKVELVVFCNKQRTRSSFLHLLISLFVKTSEEYSSLRIREAIKTDLK
jgi:hypothetical protein